jgi:hypothetical protein
MSQAFVREGGGAPLVRESRESAESTAEMYRTIDGVAFDYEVRARERGGYMIARLLKDGSFDSWVEE